ncbi:MAG: hypothetical protein KOO63_08165 [Bacteroidales bacterium]|nr:hypothetical protein [Candidatus Latescibacterota bacterium]
MAAREVITLNETTPQLEAPQAGDSYEMPRDVNITGNLTVTGSFPATEGSAILSTGEAGGTKYLREDGDNSCSWQAIAGGGLTVLFKSANYTASAGEFIVCDSSGGAFTVTLPVGPSATDQVFVVDGVGSCGTNTVTVARNGETILGDAEDFELDQDFGQANFAYGGADWQHALSGTPDIVNANDFIYGYRGVIDFTGTSESAIRNHEGQLITMTNGSANTYTIPAEASVNYDIGTKIDVMQKGTGQTTIALTTDSLLGNVKIDAQYDVVTVVKTASAEWVVLGGVV